MKRIFTIILFAISLFDALAQVREVDSLKIIVSETQSDSLRVYTLNRLSKIYRLSKPDSSMLLASQALEISKAAGLVHGEAVSLQEMGNTYLMMGNHPMALEAYMEMLKINE